MTTRKARIADNDPLNRTAKVLARFEQADTMESQPVDLLTSQPDNKESTTVSSEKELPNKPESQQVNQLDSQPERENTLVNQLESEQVNNLLSQQSNQPTSNNLGEEEVKKSTSQKDDVPALELKKATFQIDKVVLKKLEKFVLTLQLELGKENAPYKEVIVEEALERLLALDQNKLIKALERRQKRRESGEVQI
jgi:predicted GIY-YIG superfamily endonuclease